VNRRLGARRWLMIAALAAALVPQPARADDEPSLLGAIAAQAIEAWEALIELVKGEPPAGGGDDDDDHRAAADDAEPVPIVAGIPAVRIDPEAQRLAGIETARLARLSVTPEIAAIGEAVDIQPLLDLRARYRELYFQAQAVEIRADAAGREFQRLQALYADGGGIAMKTVQEAETESRAVLAERNRLWVGLDEVRSRALRQWGPVLAGWAFNGQPAALARLAGLEDTLVVATLPVGVSLVDGVDSARLAADGRREHARPVTYLSAAPNPGGEVSGEAHFFRAEGQSLPVGLRVALWIPASAQPIAGIGLPAGAVVRALGRAWAYVRVDDAHFVRREVALDHAGADGVYVVDTLAEDDEVVVSGAVAVYAEEFRSQIRNEDD